MEDSPADHTLVMGSSSKAGPFKRTPNRKSLMITSQIRKNVLSLSNPPKANLETVNSQPLKNLCKDAFEPYNTLYNPKQPKP